MVELVRDAQLGSAGDPPGASGGWIERVVNPDPVDGGAAPSPGKDRRPDVVLESTRIGTTPVDFYVDFGPDSAVLGFSIADATGRPRYFPMYGSTYRGLPPVTLEAFVSDTQQEMWVHSSWRGYELLAYHRLGTDRCATRYGEISSFAEPTPPLLGGTTTRLPPMDVDRASKVVTVRYAA